MLISYKWLKDYIDFDLSVEEVAEILTNTGLEVDEISKYRNIKELADSIVVGHVLETKKHPDADRLTICKVDVGGAEPHQIICGAPNVASGQKVAVAKVGTSLKTFSGDEIKIKKAKIRGVESFGMICAEDELGLSEDHDGIMVLNKDLTPGKKFIETLDLYEDEIIDIAITPNRGDAISHIGVARDLAAYLQKELKYPDVSGFKAEESKNVPVTIEIPELCPRYSALVIDGLEVKESPKWLQNRLRALGLNPVNNLVDVTNYVMMETGQPLHAFDLNELKGPEIIVKNLPKGTKFKTLDESEIELDGSEIMICDAKGGVAMGGVMGGYNSMVSESTTSILLESAHFNPSSIRKTARTHGFATDSSYRFERTTDPNATVEVMKRAALLMLETAGGKIVSDVIDVYPKPVINKEIFLSFDFVNKIVGNKILPETLRNVLSGLEYHILEENNEGFKIEVPTYRADVLRPIDLIEEFLRIYSYNKISFSEQVTASLPKLFIEQKHHLKNRISDALSGNGFYELFTQSFTPAKYVEEGKSYVKTLNAVNKNLDTLKIDFLTSGLEVISYNFNRNVKNIKCYDFGKVYFRNSDGSYGETEKFGLWVTGLDHEQHWFRKSQQQDIYVIKAYVENVLRLANIRDYKMQKFDDERFAYGIKYLIEKEEIVKMGFVNPEILEKFDIKQDVYYAEIEFSKIIKKTERFLDSQQPSKFPGTTRDLSIIIDQQITFEEIKENILTLNNKLLKDIKLIDVFEGGSLNEGQKSYALRMSFQDSEKTLKDKQVDGFVNKVIKNLESNLNLTVRK
jgi:phenylalanyl-tRNA synthetase beta chain